MAIPCGNEGGLWPRHTPWQGRRPISAWMHEKWLCCSTTDGSSGTRGRGLRMFAQRSQNKGDGGIHSAFAIARDGRGKAASDDRFRTSSGNRLALLFSFLQRRMGRSASTLPVVVVLVQRLPGGSFLNQTELRRVRLATLLSIASGASSRCCSGRL